jgi:hypothetical protein
VTRHGALQLDVVAVIRRQKIGTDQQQNDLGALQMGINRASPLGPSHDVAVMPAGNHAMAP